MDKKVKAQQDEAPDEAAEWRAVVAAGATLDGFEEWSMSCASDAQRSPEAGEGDRVFRVPVTVDYTLTRAVVVRADDVGEAIEAAREFAAARFPAGFSIDEGNYRGACDFYVPDDESVYEIEPPASGATRSRGSKRARR